MDTALIDHGSGVARSVSEIPLVAGSISRGPSSLSSANLSPPREPAPPPTTPPAVEMAMLFRPPRDWSGRPELSASPPRSPVPLPPATAAPINNEDVSKLDLAIMGCSISFVVPVALYIKDLTISWETPLRVLYGVLMITSLASTVTGFFTAWCPAGSWGRRLSSAFARMGLVDASSLFIVFVACKLGRLGCAAGLAAAALVVLIWAVVWIWSEWWPPTGRAEAATVLQDGVGLPNDAP